MLTKRHNPSRYIYLGSGVSLWAVDHTYHSIQGWENSIMAANPEVVTIADWNGPIRRELQAWLKTTYGKGTHFGHWLLFAKPPDPRSRGEHGDHPVGGVPYGCRSGRPSTFLRSATAAGCGTLSRPPIRFAHSRSGARSMAARSDGYRSGRWNTPTVSPQ